MENKKQEIRDQVNVRIQDLNTEQRESFSQTACENLKDFLLARRCRRVLLFSSLADEISLLPFIQQHQKEFDIFLPKADTRTLELSVHPIKNYETDVAVGAYNISEPITSAVEITPGVLDCVVVPARAIDYEGNRLGRGLGYYDRFLAKFKDSKTLIACCLYQAQIVFEVPVESFDVPVSFCITEKGYFHLRRK